MNKTKFSQKVPLFNSSPLLSSNKFLTRQCSYRDSKWIVVITSFLIISTRSSNQFPNQTHRHFRKPEWVSTLLHLALVRMSLLEGLTSQMSLKLNPIYQCRCEVPVSGIIRPLIQWWLDQNFSSHQCHKILLITRHSVFKTLRASHYRRESHATTGLKMVAVDLERTAHTSTRLKTISKNPNQKTSLTKQAEPQNAEPSIIVNTVSSEACACSDMSTKSSSSC